MQHTTTGSAGAQFFTPRVLIDQDPPTPIPPDQFFRALVRDTGAAVTFLLLDSTGGPPIAQVRLPWTAGLGWCARGQAAHPLASAYFAVQATFATDRRREVDMAFTRALKADLDARGLSQQVLDDLMSWGRFAPHAVVRSSAGKAHVYWWISRDAPWGLWERYQQALIAHLAGRHGDGAVDATCKDRSRVLRVPGSLHRKPGQPETRVTVLRCEEGELSCADLEQMFAAIPLPPERPARSAIEVAPGDWPPKFTRLLDALEVREEIESAEGDLGWRVRCPNADEHSMGSDEAILYAPNEKNGHEGGYCCMHAHCQHRFGMHQIAGLRAWVEAGAPESLEGLERGRWVATAGDFEALTGSATVAEGDGTDAAPRGLNGAHRAAGGAPEGFGLDAIEMEIPPAEELAKPAPVAPTGGAADRFAAAMTTAETLTIEKLPAYLATLAKAGFSGGQEELLLAAVKAKLKISIGALRGDLAKAKAGARGKRQEAGPRGAWRKGDLLKPVDGAVRVVPSMQACALLVPQLKNTFAYHGTAGLWYAWRGDFWQTAKTEARAHVYQMIETGTDDGAEILGETAYVARVTEGLERGGALELPECKLGERDVPFRNGVLNTETKELRPLSANTGNKWRIPHDWDPTAECPRIKAWLLRAMGGDAEMVEYLQAIFAAVITGRADLQKFFCLFGLPNAGKSTMAKLFEGIMDKPMTGHFRIHDVETGRFEIAGFRDIRLAIFNETTAEIVGKGDMPRLKQITGGDKLSGEIKGKQRDSEDTFRFQGIVLLLGNESMKHTDFTGALYRRARSIHMRHPVSEAEITAWRARNGDQELLAELPGLIRWALELSRDEVAERIENPPAAAVAEDIQVQIDNDRVLEYALARLTYRADRALALGVARARSGGGVVTYEAADRRLYPNFLTWLQDNGYRGNFSRRDFLGRLQRIFRTFPEIQYAAEIKKHGQDSDHNQVGFENLDFLRDGEPPYPWIAGVSADRILRSSHDSDAEDYENLQVLSEIDTSKKPH